MDCPFSDVYEQVVPVPETYEVNGPVGVTEGRQSVS